MFATRIQRASPVPRIGVTAGIALIVVGAIWFYAAGHAPRTSDTIGALAVLFVPLLVLLSGLYLLIDSLILLQCVRSAPDERSEGNPRKLKIFAGVGIVLNGVVLLLMLRTLAIFPLTAIRAIGPGAAARWLLPTTLFFHLPGVIPAYFLYMFIRVARQGTKTLRNES